MKLMNIDYDIYISFEKVIVGSIEKKNVVLYDISKSFLVQQHFLYLHQNLSQFSVRKKDDANVELIYKPTIPNTLCVDYFKVVDNNVIKKIICVKGECIGPNITISTNRLDFYRIKGEKCTVAKVELFNHSDTITKFQFDIDNNQCIFKFEPTIGFLMPKKHLFVQVSFKAKERGAHYLEVPCLVEYQDPVYLELFGINDPLKEKSVLLELKTQYKPMNFMNGFPKYMETVIKDKYKNEICSLTDLYLDFGCASVTNFNDTLSSFLRNSSKKCLALKWNQDADTKEFVMQQSFIQIFPGEIVEMECKYLPSKSYKFSCTHLYGRVFLYDGLSELEIIKEDGVVQFPVPIIIRMLGHSFCDKCSWIPEVTVKPRIVLMQLTVPNHEIYNTFILERKGTLPSLFKFKPPDNTYFYVKPMQGLITETHQIIVVKCVPTIATNSFIMEKWQLELNGVANNDVEVIFKTVVSVPDITIGDDNEIDFGEVYPGCQKIKVVRMRNNTGHSYGFKFFETENISMRPVRGRIESCECIEVEFYYLASFTLPESVSASCSLTVIKCLKLLTGEPYNFTVNVRGKCVYSRPSCLLKEYDFGEIQCEDVTTTSFYLYNFGVSDLHIDLWYKDDEQNAFVAETPVVSLEPCKVTLGAETNIQVTVTLRPLYRGDYKGSVYYSIRRNEKSDEIVDNNNLIWPDCGIVFNISYTCVYPTLQFVDIVENNCGSLFGNMNLWEMLKIEKLNLLLRTINRNETEKHYLRMPGAEHSINIKKDIIFVLENITNFNTTCQLVRKKICDCVYKVVQKTMTRKEKIFDCPHRELIDVKLSNEDIIANSTEYLTITMAYNMENLQTICFRMLLPQNRCIVLFFKIMGLEADASILSPFTWNLRFKMKDVYVGVKKAGLQAYWFYNNTKYVANYKLVIDEINKLNAKYGTEVLCCLNPVGVLESKSLYPVYFKFNPVDLKKIEMTLPFEYGRKVYQLKVTGRGVIDLYTPTKDIAGSLFGLKDYHHPDVKVSLSTETFIIGPVMTYTTATRMFFLKNRDRSRVMAFSFEMEEKPGILLLSVQPVKGLLQPKEMVACVLTVRTYGRGAATRTQLPCHFVDYTQLRDHINSKEEFHKRGMQMQHEFVFGEKGMNFQMQNSIPEICRPPKIHNRSLSVTVYIVDACDRDVKISLEEQLQSVGYRSPRGLFRRCLLERLAPGTGYNEAVTPGGRPGRRFRLSPAQSPCEDCDDRKLPLEMDDDCYLTVHTVLENLVSETLTSAMFRSLVEETAKLPPLYYGQCRHKRGGSTRRALVRQTLNTPPPWLMAGVLERLARDALLAMFDLAAAGAGAAGEGGGAAPEQAAAPARPRPRHSAAHARSMFKDNYTEMFMFLLDHF